MKRKGFTLIELLIVVAIIAILAAIAVPNFLEAQTRAKVSRVMADMRSIATAIEAYTVDYNRPPLDRVDWAVKGVSMMDGGWPFVPLTTPVAYLTSIPRDPFVPLFEEPWFRHVEYFTSTGSGREESDRNSPSDPASFFYGPRGKYRWLLDSPGPDMRWEWLHLPRWAGNVIYYDPTNGTKSQGDIYYYGSSGGINPPPVTSR
jgi:prepilin-type N-terminal cleavage/methylation domain-containing protein